MLLEKQKVKAFLADNRVYGVDLNPVAIELAEISHLAQHDLRRPHDPMVRQPARGRQQPDRRAAAGVSRSAAHRRRARVARAVPERVRLTETRRDGYVYHFLAPDQGWPATATRS